MKTISVILPVYNADNTLGEAIESLKKQDFPNFECLIVNDASTDKTGQILKRFSDKRFHSITNKKRLGLTASLNIGLEKTTAPFIARMDADDIALPHRFSRQLNYLTKDENLALVGSWVECIDSQGEKISERHYPTSYTEIRNVIMQFTPFIHPSVMIRREVLDRVGYYDEELDGAEDYDLFLRIAKDYKVENIPEILLRYRIAETSVSWREMKKTEIAAIRARLKALTHYHYPLWQAVYLVKPVLSFLVPTALKREILSHTFSS